MDPPISGSRRLARILNVAESSADSRLNGMNSAVSADRQLGSEHASMGIWARGGLTVTGLHREFADPGWRHRGKYRALKQFIMNWNNWPSYEDRAAMLDGPPHKSMSRDEKARVAAVVRCLCQRDGHPIPKWVRRARPSRLGVALVDDLPIRSSRLGTLSPFARSVRDETPKPAAAYRVWFEPATLSVR